MPEETLAAGKTESVRKGGKFLTFVLGDEEYGIEILKVREIIGVMDITTVPRTPDFIKGVINLRGKVIPVIDLRLKFDMEEAEYTSETCIIVVDIKGILVGIVVDTVSEVTDVVDENIEPAPSFGSSVDTEYIMGMAKVGDKVKILLDINKVLSAEEFQMTQSVG